MFLDAKKLFILRSATLYCWIPLFISLSLHQPTVFDFQIRRIFPIMGTTNQILVCYVPNFLPIKFFVIFGLVFVSQFVTEGFSNNYSLSVVEQVVFIPYN